MLAHEFGHFRGGDTALGRWIYRTHSAIVRTLMNLQDSLLQKPFLWYGKLFLRITNAISRQQEYAADAFAVEVAGGPVFAEALRKVHGAAMAYDAYWHTELVPVLGSGFRTDIAGGFARFMADTGIARRIGEVVAAAEREEQTDPYDTHPALPDRLAAIQSLAAVLRPENTQPAISLLNDVAEQEDRLLRFQFGAEQVGQLTFIGWQEVGTRVYVPMWQNTVQEHADLFRGVTLDQLPGLLRAGDALYGRIREKAEGPLNDEDVQSAATGIVGAALAQTLAGLGWRVDLRRPAATCNWSATRQRGPVPRSPQLAGGRSAAAAWSGRCRELRLAGTLVRTDAPG